MRNPLLAAINQQLQGSLYLAVLLEFQYACRSPGHPADTGLIPGGLWESEFLTSYMNGLLRWQEPPFLLIQTSVGRNVASSAACGLVGCFCFSSRPCAR